MKLGIVGSEQAKFTEDSSVVCIASITALLNLWTPDAVVSGGCHLGGVDQWAAMIGKDMGIPVIEHLPKRRSWEGYKARNILIAEDSDLVLCYTVSGLPPDFKEGGWERYCYHCKTNEHIKSGGCWTVKYAKSIGKKGEVVVIPSGT